MSVTSVPGFKAGGLASGIKESGAPDLAMVATVDGQLERFAENSTIYMNAAIVIVFTARLTAYCVSDLNELGVVVRLA